ncbi:MAG: histidine phosphatase family protein [Pseudomonadota bacterium]|nr:histidine phosphatase family protein [Pseudomonadota bacterium]
MAGYPEIYILRHGETEWNREGRFQGGFDSSLTPLGRQQALDQNRILQALELGGYQWMCSPQERALETAEIAKGDRSDIRIVSELREISMGHWAGQLRRDIEAETPGLETGGLALYWQLPGGETPYDVAQRCKVFLDCLTGPSVIVTHGVTLRILACVYFGRGVRSFETYPADHGAVYRLGAAGFEALTRFDGSSVNRD